MSDERQPYWITGKGLNQASQFPDGGRLRDEPPARSLTRLQIEAMPAGRDLDLLIAEHVKIEGVRIEPGYMCLGRCDDNGLYSCWKYRGDGIRSEFDPSTDLAAAWAVVEAIIAEFGKGWADESVPSYFSVMAVKSQQFRAGAMSRWTDEHSNDEYSWNDWSDGDTVPLAICRFALCLFLSA